MILRMTLRMALRMALRMVLWMAVTTRLRRRCPATKKGQNPNTVDREEPEADPAAVKGAASATRVAPASGLY